MNCDLVFEILTRGPFPAGEPTDASVELHLARCHDCRRLAEALRPAVELFHETLASEGDTDMLPGYYGALSEAEGPLSTAVASPPLWSQPVRPWEEAPVSTFNSRRPMLPRARRWAFGMILGMAACLLLAIFSTQPRPHGDRQADALPSAGAPALAAMAPSAEEIRALLASLQLPAACLSTPREGVRAPESPTSTSHAAEDLLCCTHCHNAAASHRPPVSAVALLQREACVACHQFE